MDADRRLIDEITRVLSAAGDAERAIGQQRYMKSAMPYRGLTSAELRSLLRPVVADWRPERRQVWEGTVRALWDAATYREERYASLKLARHRRARVWLDREALPLLGHLVQTGAWWDLVDEVATHPLRDALLADRAGLTPQMRQWATAADLWTRRAAVLCQVGAKEATDRDLLRDTIEANVADRSFWLRKAIGWALRDYARTEPGWVSAEVERWGDRLSGLSRREATKHLA